VRLKEKGNLRDKDMDGEYDDVEWTDLTKDWNKWRSLINKTMNFCDNSTISFSRRNWIFFISKFIKKKKSIYGFRL
jgi:hypothetical protein